MKHRTGWRALLVALVLAVALLAFLWMHLRDSPAQDSSKKSAISSAPLPGQGSRSSTPRFDQSAEALSAHGEPLADVVSSYELVKTCYRYKRLEGFYTAKSKDPSSPLSNPAEFAKAPPEQQAYANQVMAFLKQQEATCGSWASTTQQLEANIEMYSAARAAALRGNEDAATCYVAAGWQSPDERQPEYRTLADNYAKDVPRLVSQALSSGSWAVVTAAAKNLGEQHGLRTESGLTPSRKYLVARLTQLGAADSVAAAQYGSYAAAQARALSPAKLVDLDRQASQLYAEKFGRSRVSRQDILDKCVN